MNDARGEVFGRVDEHRQRRAQWPACSQRFGELGEDELDGVRRRGLSLLPVRALFALRGERVLPADDDVEYVVARISKGAWKYRARVLVHAPAAQVAAKLPIPVDIEVVDESTCQLELGADAPDRLALWLTQLDVDLEVIDGDELAVAFDRLATRFRRAAARASST